jgi:hypothetical protein
MKTVFLILPTIVALLLIGCMDKNQQNETSQQEMTATVPALSDSIIKPNELKQTSNLDMLQGKWQHIDDSSNFLVFENNHRKEIVEGMKEWDDEEFIISDNCKNESDKEREIIGEKDRYISLAESDMCWYIIELDSSTLSLSYVGRGNTLTYEKVK